MIHGFTGTSQGWKHGTLYPALLQAGYKVVILDMRGNGQSDKPHTGAGYANNAEAKDVMALAGSFSFNKYAVVGYSGGSIITSRLMMLDKRITKAVMGGMGTDYTTMASVPGNHNTAGNTVQFSTAILNFLK